MQYNNHSPISLSTGHGKMSPQAALGYKHWPDEESRQSKWVRKPRRKAKRCTLRTHRTGK